jgi:glycosyltransferase involved in cell wall biosynthesis
VRFRPDRYWLFESIVGLENPSMMSSLSVLISTHNPHPQRLHRTIEGLLAQTLPLENWELVVVDNASTTPIRASDFCINRHPRGRVVCEGRLGLTYGRLCGIASSTGPLVVFVDDDNVLAPDYLREAVDAFARQPKLGLGGGRCLPEWEAAPAPWVAEFQGNLALRDLGDQEQIVGPTDPLQYPLAAPVGAGMVGRREAITPWANAFNRGATGPTGRKGNELTSGEDCDIVLSALKAGWHVGYFPQLMLTHLMPAGRLTAEYQARLNHGIAKSWVQVLSRHGIRPWPPASPWGVPLRKWRAWLSYRAWAGPAEYVRWRGACGQFEGRALIGRP